MKIIGLTGGIASGKTTVSGMIRKLGIPVVCADQIAREVVRPGLPAYLEIKKYFERDLVFRKDGFINRERLGAVIFQDQKKRKRLNSIVHPVVMDRIREKMARHLKRGTEILVLDIPLLYETKLEKMCDQVVVVYAPESILLDRLVYRSGFNEEYALRRLRSQMNIEEKKERADFMIDNSGPLSKTKKQVQAWIARLKAPEFV